MTTKQSGEVNSKMSVFSYRWLLCLAAIVITMNLPVFTANVKAKTAVKIGDLMYEIDTDAKTAKVLKDESYYTYTTVKIPASVTYGPADYPVTVIDKEAFQYCTFLENITIPNSVTTIGDSAFYRCTNLSAVELPNGLTSVGNAAFYECKKLTSVEIPSSVTSMGKSLFYSCASLKKVVLPGTISKIEDYTFHGCESMTMIDIPTTVTSIGMNAFSNTGLVSVAIPKDVTSIGNSAFMNCISLSSINIPDGITTINNNLFYGCSKLRYIELPDSVESIEGGAFKNCMSLQEIRIPKKVTTISAGTFRGCDSLSNVIFPEKLSVISSYAFHHTALQNVVIPDGVTIIGDSAFGLCSSLTSIYIPASVTSMRSNTFYESDIQKVRLQVIFECTSAYKGTDSSYWSDIKEVVLDHQGGEATCVSCPTCGRCGTPYGTVDSSKHDLVESVTKATRTKDGVRETKCSLCGEVTKKKVIPAASVVKLAKAAFTYDGKAKKPAVIVEDSKGNSIQTNNYDVTYAPDRKAVGKYAVSVKFKNDYTGSKNLSFEIDPKGTSLTNVTAKSKSFTAVWKKQTTQTTGYELQYTTDKTFKNDVKSVKVDKNSIVSKTVKNLKAKKTYYIRVRTYKTVAGKKYYSDWSEAKKVTTLKN